MARGVLPRVGVALRSWLLGAGLLAAAACGGTREAEPDRADEPPAPVCVPGDRRTCNCGGDKGAQLCRAAGDGFDGCRCVVDAGDGGVPGQAPEPPSSGCGTCDGCCHGRTCVPLASESDTLCGKRGEECAACTGGSCDAQAGACVLKTAGACDATTCPKGCCSPTGCVATPDWSHCGAGGAACAACPIAGSQCAAGACTDAIADDEYYYLAVRSIQVPGATSWVPWDSLPDPYACMSYSETGTDGQPVKREGCSKSCDDTTSCALTQADGLLRHCYTQPSCLFCSRGATVCDPTLFRGSALKAGALDITVLDHDWPSDSIIGKGKVPASDRLTTARYATGSFGQVMVVEYEVLYALP
jgi:hypothetical protein